MLGVFDDVRLSERTISLVPGDKILMYTDAVTEAARPDGELLGVEGLRSFTGEYHDLAIEPLIERIHALGQAFSGQAR